MKTIIKWFAGFFEDVVGVASSKRAIGFVASYLLVVIVFAARDGKWANDSIHMQIFWGIVGIIAFVIGAITKESVDKIIGFKLGKKDSTDD